MKLFVAAVMAANAAAESLIPQLVDDAPVPNYGCQSSYIGEIRVYQDKSQCLDIARHDGEGNFQTAKCDGYRDQQLVVCLDGTIINLASNHCVGTDWTSGIGNVSANDCNGQLYQQWDFTKVGSFHDAGIYQDAYQITNRYSGLCLDIYGTDGSGNAQVDTCTGNGDQMFYFRNRGQVVNTGRLYNAANNQCFNTSVDGVDCDSSHDKQYWTYYENGEIVSKSSLTCMDVAKHSGSGEVGNYPCEDQMDQMWDTQCENDYCYYINKMNPNSCLDARSAGSRVYSQTCDWSPSQQFKWI